MGRKVEDVVVPSWGNRDAGKTYRITEKPAIESEKWGLQMVLVMKGTSAYIPDDVARLGMVAVAIRLTNAVLAADMDWAKLEPLLDQLLTCVQIVRDVTIPDPVTGLPLATKLLPDDIEESHTVSWLRSEVLRVHTGFSYAGALWTLFQATQALADTQNTSTSPAQSGS